MRIGAVLAAAFTVCFPSSANATGRESAWIPPSIDAYARAIRADTTRNVERLYRLGLRAADDLMSPSLDLESLSEETFEALQDSMRGFVLFRDEGSFVSADPEFFTNLSQARGDSVSADFFETVWRSDSYGIPAPYIELVTDYSGCTKFGSLELVRCYRFWDAFKRRHPRRYADRVRGFLSGVEEELTGGTCACEGKEETLREFRAFASEFPNASITPQVRERIKALRAGTSGMRYKCGPG